MKTAMRPSRILAISIPCNRRQNHRIAWNATALTGFLPCAGPAEWVRAQTTVHTVRTADALRDVTRGAAGTPDHVHTCTILHTKLHFQACEANRWRLIELGSGENRAHREHPPGAAARIEKQSHYEQPMRTQGRASQKLHTAAVAKADFKAGTVVVVVMRALVVVVMVVGHGFTFASY